MVRNNTTRARLIAIGNSRGVRIPKPFIQQAGLGDEVDLQVSDDAIVIRSSRRPRTGWAAAFAQMAKRQDDRLLDRRASWGNKFDKADWQWR